MDLMSAVDDYHVFDIEIALDNHVGVLPNPFPGMDKSTSAICNFHLRGYCQRETMCPNRHIRYFHQSSSITVSSKTIDYVHCSIVQRSVESFLPFTNSNFFSWFDISLLPSLSTSKGRSNCGLQALAARSVQEGRRLRVSPRIRHDENARMLLLPKVRHLPEQRMPVPTHRPDLEDQRLPLVRPRILSTRALLPAQAHETRLMYQLSRRILSRW